MQILIYHTGKLVKFPCFSAINHQITCTLPFILAPFLPARNILRTEIHAIFLRTLVARELMTSASRGGENNHQNNAVARDANWESGGRKHPYGSYLRQSSRELDLDFPTHHYIISALSSGEYRGNDQLAGRSECTRFGNGRSRWLLHTRIYM